MLPQTNGRVIAVTRGGTSADYDAPAGEGLTLPENGFECYATERRATFAEANALNRATIAYALVPGDAGIEWQQGDVLTIRHSDGAVVERTVREIRARRIDTLPLQPVRLDFEES